MDLNITESAESKLTKALFITENVIRTIGVVLHLIYFGYVLKNRKLHKNSLIYLHHVNFVSFLYCLHYMFYLINDRPNTFNEILNKYLCLISEALWSMLKFLRSYVLLKLAVYQYLAAYKTATYRRISSSRRKLLIPVYVLWLASVAFYLGIKFGMNTVPSPILCFDSYPQRNKKHAISTYSIISIISTFTPSILVLFLYYLITKRMRESRIRSGRVRQVNLEANSHCICYIPKALFNDATIKCLLMNIAAFMSTLSIVVLYICMDLDYININNLCLLRISTVFFQSFIPLISTCSVHSFLKRENNRRRIIRLQSRRRDDIASTEL